MSHTTTYSQARANFAKICDAAIHEREVIRITRRGKEDVVLVAADEFEGLLETAHLLRSPQNASRLLAAIQQALQHNGQPQTIKNFKQEVGLSE